MEDETILNELRAMRRENRDDLKSVVDKLDDGFKAVAEQSARHALDDAIQFAAIDKRLAPLEEDRKTRRWAMGALLAAGAAAVFDVVAHLPKIFGK